MCCITLKNNLIFDYTLIIVNNSYCILCIYILELCMLYNMPSSDRACAITYNYTCVPRVCELAFFFTCHSLVPVEVEIRMC